MYPRSDLKKTSTYCYLRGIVTNIKCDSYKTVFKSSVHYLLFKQVVFITRKTFESLKTQTLSCILRITARICKFSIFCLWYGLEIPPPLCFPVDWSYAPTTGTKNDPHCGAPVPGFFAAGRPLIGCATTWVVYPLESVLCNLKSEGPLNEKTKIVRLTL